MKTFWTNLPLTIRAAVIFCYAYAAVRILNLFYEAGTAPLTPRTLLDGALTVALVVGLVMPASTPVGWVRDFARGLAQGCEPCGAGVVGGDLSSGDSLIVSVTVLGDLEGRAPVLRSGARPGDAVVHVGTLGRSAAGLALLSAGSDCASGSGAVVHSGQEHPQAWACIEAFRAPTPPLAAGRDLARAGATSMLDVSDGLLRDAGRIARASDVVIDLDDPGDLPDASFLEPVAALVSGCDGSAAHALARSWLLTGGEDHGLLATVPAHALDQLPAGARMIGRVLSPQSSPARVLGHRPGVLLAGEPAQEHTGWDHFSHA